MDAATSRVCLLASSIGLVEDLQSAGVSTRISADDFSPAFQVCLPYRGVFVWHVAHDTIVSDPNTVLFVRAGEAFRLSQPVFGGYGELILTPAPSLLAELLGTAPSRLSDHTLFARRRRVTDLTLHRARTDSLHAMRTRAWDQLAADEALIRLLRTALNAAPAHTPSSLSTARLIDRTKQYLTAHAGSPVRLCDIAANVGASPAYLTHTFRHSEGLPAIDPPLTCQV